MKQHRAPAHDILQEHELWANKISTFITGIFGLCAVPVFFVLQNVLLFWRIMLSLIAILLATGLSVVSRKKKAAGLTKHVLAVNNSIMDATNSLAGIAEEASAGTEEISATTQQQAATIDRIVEQIKDLEQMASALDLLVNKT